MSECRLIMGDCLDVLPTLPAGSIDLVLADPPYGTTACKWDTIIPLEPLWRELKRVIKPRGAVVMTASQPFTTTLISSNPTWFKYCWVWVKEGKGTGFVHAKNAPLKQHEDVLVFSPGVVNHEGQTVRRMNYFPQWRQGKPYRKIQRSFNGRNGSLHNESAANAAYVGSVSESDGRRYPTSVLEIPRPTGRAVHPTQKPVALMEYLIRTYTSEGETVLDFCFGSGTTGVAALNTGRDFVGVELDPTYFAIAEKRIEKARIGGPLFTEQPKEETLYV